MQIGKEGRPNQPITALKLIKRKTDFLYMKISETSKR